MAYSLLNFVQPPVSWQNFRDRRLTQGKIIKYHDLDATSDCNEYIPFYSIRVNKGVYNGKLIHYSLLNDMYGTEGRNMVNTYPKLYGALVRNELPITFKTRAMTYKVRASKGAIWEETEFGVKILFLFAMRSDYITSLRADKENGTIDNSKFAVIISRDFMTNPKYRNLYKKIYNDRILREMESGIEVIITNDIAKRCYSNDRPKVKFRNMSELRAYLEAFNKIKFDE